MIVAEIEPVVASRKSDMLRQKFDRFGEDFSDGRLTEQSPTERHFRLHEGNAFFVDKGEWTKYASLQDKRVGSTRYLRDGRQMVETVTVTVDRAGLKKKLQEDGIIPKEGRY